MASAPDGSAGLGAQAGSAPLLTFCLPGTEKSLKESFQNSELKVHPQSCSSGATSENYGAGTHKGVTEGSFSAQGG